MCAGLESGLHLGLSGVGPVCGQPVPYGGVRLLVGRRLLQDQQPLSQFLGLFRHPLQGILGLGGSNRRPLGLAHGATGLTGQPSELLGYTGLLPVGGPAPLPEVLDEGGARSAPLIGGLLNPGQFLASYGQFGQFGELPRPPMPAPR